MAYLKTKTTLVLALTLSSVRDVFERPGGGVPAGSLMWKVQGTLDIYPLLGRSSDFKALVYFPPRGNRLYFTDFRTSSENKGIVIRALDTLFDDLGLKALRELKESSPRLASKMKRARRPETDLQKAIWNVWDHLDGVEKIREREGFLYVAGSVASDIEAMTEDPTAYKFARSLGRAVNKLRKQIRSWGAAYNLSMEGKTVLDTERTAAQLEVTRKIIREIYVILEKLSKINFPDYEVPGIERDLRNAKRAAAKSTAAVAAALQEVR